MPELDLVKGPLDEAGLAEVAALYGVTDGKYGSVDHCRLLFNQSPFGPTLHAFVRDEGKAVGHYCLIPYDLVVDGRRVKAAKGEALHVAESHRRSEIEGLPTSSALLEGAQRLAVQEGIEICYAIVGAPGVIRLFGRCSYPHQPFQVRELLLPQTRALPLQRVAKVKLAGMMTRFSCSEPLREVQFAAVEERMKLQLTCPPSAWQPVVDEGTLAWFGQAPSNRFFQLGEVVVWLAQTHQDWEVLCTFSADATVPQRVRMAIELRKEATRRGIDRIRVPFLQGIEPEMASAFALLARRQVDREVSLVVRSENPLGPVSPSGFLWAHF